MSYNVFRMMRDDGKFSKKSEGRHSYFLYLDLDDDDNREYEKDNHSLSPPPAPRYFHRKEPRNGRSRQGRKTGSGCTSFGTLVRAVHVGDAGEGCSRCAPAAT